MGTWAPLRDRRKTPREDARALPCFDERRHATRRHTLAAISRQHVQYRLNSRRGRFYSKERGSREKHRQSEVNTRGGGPDGGFFLYSLFFEEQIDRPARRHGAQLVGARALVEAQRPSRAPTRGWARAPAHSRRGASKEARHRRDLRQLLGRRRRVSSAAAASEHYRRIREKCQVSSNIKHTHAPHSRREWPLSRPALLASRRRLTPSAYLPCIEIAGLGAPSRSRGFVFISSVCRGDRGVQFLPRAGP